MQYLPILIVLLVVSCSKQKTASTLPEPIQNKEPKEIMKDPQMTWDEYYSDIKSRRIKEAKTIWHTMALAGVTEESVLALDFKAFSSVQADAKSLAKQLEENYEVKVVPAGTSNYWCVEGTTRPYGIEFSESDHKNWVEFMCDVSQSHACVFSAWTIEDTSLAKTWSTQN